MWINWGNKWINLNHVSHVGFYEGILTIELTFAKGEVLAFEGLSKEEYTDLKGRITKRMW